MQNTIKAKVGSWEKGSVNNPADVKTVQSLLIKVAAKLNNNNYKPNGINGLISKPPKTSSTVKAIKDFQRQVLLMPTPDGRVDPGGTTIKALNYLIDSSNFDKMSDANPKLKKQIYSFIAKYSAVSITSGKRSVRKQAELMAPMSDNDLNMYGSTTYYIVQIKALTKAKRTVTAVEKILNDARKKGSRISHHLTGNAVDISAKGAFNWAKAELVAKKVGLTSKKETWRNCFHVQLK